MAKTYKITMADPYFSSQDRARIHAEVEAILSGLLSMGPNVKAFEEEFARMVGVRHAIAMNSCTSALEAALVGLGVNPDDEVIIPGETFIATGMAVHLVGGAPVFAEIFPETFCLDLGDVKRRGTARTKGIIMVYMGGLIPPNIEDFVKYCEAQGWFLIEDAAHAPGARLGGKAAGSFGHAGCFSFFPTKVITAGEGGMLTTDDEKVARVVRSLQHRGRDFDSAHEQYSLPGRNVRLPEFSALLGRIQLGHLKEFLAERQRVMTIYRLAFREDARVKLITPSEETASAYWKVPLLLPRGVDRVALTSYLQEAGVFIDHTYNPPLHLQPVFRALYNISEGHLPITEDLLSRHICLPCHPRISDDEAHYVVHTLKAALDRFIS